MQRTSSSNRASDEFINVTQSSSSSSSSSSHLKRSPAKKLESEDDHHQLPIYDSSSPSSSTHSDSSKKVTVSRNKSLEKWIHVIPLILFICAFTLWWFSHSVNVEIRDGRIFAINQIPDVLHNDTQANQTALLSDTQQEKVIIPRKEIEKAELKHLANKDD